MSILDVKKVTDDRTAYKIMDACRRGWVKTRLKQTGFIDYRTRTVFDIDEAIAFFSEDNSRKETYLDIVLMVKEAAYENR